MTLRSLALIPLFLLLTLSVGAKTSMEGQDLVDLAANTPKLKTLASLIATAGLTETLKGEGPLTVLAPSDEAFAKLKKSEPKIYESLSTHPDLLKQVLSYHVIEGKVPSTDFTDKEKPTTLEGDTVLVHVKKGSIKINQAKVVGVDLQASNGVIHVIDTVLLPPSPKKIKLKPAKTKAGKSAG